MREYSQGPIPLQKRSCTDLICLILLFLLAIGMAAAAGWAWSNGNYQRLTTPYDPDHKGCGTDYPHHHYIYFASPHVDSLYVTTCVAKCPTEENLNINCKPNSLVKSCWPKENSDNQKKLEIYNSTGVMGRVCFPYAASLMESVSGGLGGSTQAAISLSQNWMLIVIAFPLAVIFALLILLLVRCCAACFVYALILFAILALVGAGVVLIAKIDPSAKNGDEVIVVQHNQTGRLIMGILCFLAAVIVVVVVCCFRKRLALAARIIEVSAVFVAEHCCLVLLPIVLLAVMGVYVGVWAFQLLGLYSMGEPIKEPKQLPFAQNELSGLIKGLIALHVFHLFWAVTFMVETGSFLISGTAVGWYYRQQDPYSQTSARYRWKHMGSVAKGSFFMALVGFIKFMYEILVPQQVKDEESCLGSYKKCCDAACCLCINYLFQWFNSGAFTVVNLMGDSYCTSAMKAFTIRVNSLASTSIMMILQLIFTVLIRIGITAMTVLGVYGLIQNVERFRSSVTDPSMILIVVGVVGFAVSCLFIGVYSQAMEAIYTTYLLDVQAGGKSENCPPQLQSFLQEAQEEEHIIQQ